jgi:hypothetical protein
MVLHLHSITYHGIAFVQHYISFHTMVSQWYAYHWYALTLVCIDIGIRIVIGMHWH